MKTMQAEYKTDIALLAQDVERWRADFHRGQWQILLAVAVLIGLAVAVLKWG